MSFFKNIKNQTRFYFLLIALFISLFYISYRMNLEDRNFPLAKKGVLNYQSLAFSENGKLFLKGEWEFYWNKFYFPSDFSRANDFPLPDREFTLFPSAWNRIASRGEKNQTNPSYGFATYRLKITGLSPHEEYALFVPDINSAYTLWINGERMLNSGLTGVEPKMSIAAAIPRTIDFSADSGEITIILHISNFHHQRGGPLQHILLGRDDEVSFFDAMKIIYSGMGIISSIMMVIFLLFLDIRYRKYHKELFSILLFLALAIRISLSDSLLLLHFFPEISWEAIQKLKYIFTYCLGPLVMLVITENDRKRRFSLKIIILISIFFLLNLFIIIVPARIFTEFDLLFDIYQVLCFIYSGIILADHISKKASLYKVHTFGTILFLLLFINIRLFMTGILVSDEVSLSLILNFLFHDQFYAQSSTFFLVLYSFMPYFIIFCFYLFSKIDHLVIYLREDRTSESFGSIEMFDQYNLTIRETEILKAVINGNSNQEISEKCYISVGTVKNHLSHIYRKTNCSNRNKLNTLFNHHDST
jgi:DNA-binding CsgD family transcriptional regulator